MIILPTGPRLACAGRALAPDRGRPPRALVDAPVHDVSLRRVRRAQDRAHVLGDEALAARLVRGLRDQRVVVEARVEPVDAGLVDHEVAVVRRDRAMLTENPDHHAHVVFGGDRAREFEMRLEGVSYENIARAGKRQQSALCGRGWQSTAL